LQKFDFASGASLVSPTTGCNPLKFPRTDPSPRGGGRGRGRGKEGGEGKENGNRFFLRISFLNWIFKTLSNHQIMIFP